MTTDIQDTLFELFEQVRRDPDTLPPVPLDRWQEESVERRLLTSFQGMLEHFQQRTFQFKQAEQALREREEQYRAIFEATIDGLSINDLEDGRVIEANPALCRMFGYTYEEFIDLPPTATIHPDTYHVVADVLQRVQAGGQFQTRFVALRKDGTAFHAEGRGTPFIYKGKPHLLGATRDITEQVQAEEQLREKEAQYRAIFEATSDGLSIAGLEDGHVVEINPAACKMYGYAYEEMIGLPPTATIHPDSFHHVTEALHAIQAVGQYQARLVAMRKDGTTFHIDGRGTPFMYNGKTHILAVMRDITEQVEAEEHLREKEAQYRGIFEATYDGINILDLDGFFVEVNPAFCSMFGYTREELIGLHASALAAPVDQHILTESLETLKAGRDFQTAVARGLRKDGTIFYVESHSTTLTYGGKPHLLGVSRDITKRVEAEQRLREQEEQYRGIFEATYDGLAIADLENGCYVEANPAYCALFGYTHDELIGLHTSVLFPPERHSYLARDLETLNAGRDTQTLTQGLRKDGTVFSLEAHGTLFTYRGKPHALGVVRDITKRVEAEQQLREREEQYRSIFEATSDALLIGDLADGHVVEVNPAACQMYGYSYKEFIGLAPDVITPPDYQHLLKEARQRIQAGDQLQTQSVALRKDGTIFSVETHAGPFIYRGRPHMLAIVRDITERVEAEQHLREKEAQYRSVFEATDDGLVIQDLDGFFVEVNPAFCSMLGYTHEELIDLHYSQVTHPEYYPVVEENIQKIQAEGRAQAQGFARRKDGSSLPVEAHSTSFTYKGKPHVLGVMRDITERVEAEKQLREREEQYRSVFEATYDAMFICDQDGWIVEVNPAFCSKFGYTHDELIGLHTSILAAPESLSVLDEFLKRTKAGRDFQTVGLALRKDGTVFYADAHSTTFTYQGKPHSLGVIRDITEQVQAQEQLREREEQYRSIFEATSDGLIIRDMDGYVVEANPAACRMHGYTYEEFLGLHRSAIVHPDYYSLVAEYMQAIRAGHSFLGQAVDLRKDGTPFPVEVRGTTFIYLGKPHTLSVLRDITERVEAEKQLREREEQYRSVFEASYDGLYIRDLDGFIVEVNPAFCSIFGYLYEELIGLHVSALVAPKSQHVIDESLDVLKAGGTFQTMAQSLRKDGTTFYADAHVAPFNYKGKPHSLGIIRDITEQVQAQQLLEQRVEERTRELSTLLEVSHNVASTLELKSLLGLILEQLKTVADYDGATVTTVDGEHLVITDYRGDGREQMLGWRFPLKQLGLIWETVCRQEVVIVADVYGDTPLALAYRQVVGDLQSSIFAPTRAWMAIPMMLKERVMGVLNLSSRKPDFFTARHAALALGIANQAAIAIENARLYEQAQELAAVEERQRLARELHDSVSQALYGISLGTHTARTQLDRDPSKAAAPLDYVLSLAEAALAEMRALIFELRPESLETEGLVSALTKQSAALHARHDIAVQTDLCEEPALSLTVKQELYRIAQEALHNTVKHAQATRVDLRLERISEAVILEVCDDGKGFDATASFPGHLGLHSMQERVKSLGGVLQIESAPGQGTRVRAQVPAR